MQFAQTCQNSGNGAGHFDRASFLINGAFRDGWTDQTDGPALQTLAILQLFAQLDAPTQAVANAVIAANLNFLQNAYQGKTYNLWEEEYGVLVLRACGPTEVLPGDHRQRPRDPGPRLARQCDPVAANRPPGSLERERQLLPVADPGARRLQAPYDPNSDIVMAAIYGAVAVTDTKLLATAALLRNQWNRCVLDGLLPDQRRRSPARHRTP